MSTTLWESFLRSEAGHDWWVYVTAGSAIGFSLVLVCLVKFQGLSIYAADCGMSTVHAFLAILFCFLGIVEGGVSQGPSSPMQTLLLAMSLGYYIVDTTLVLTVVPDRAALFHHLACLWGEYCAITKGVCGGALCLNLLAGEISTPWLYAWRGGFVAQGSFAYRFCQVMFAGVFLIARIGFGPFLAKDVLSSETVPLPIKFGCATIMLLSIYWAGLILQEVLEVGRQNRTKKFE